MRLAVPLALDPAAFAGWRAGAGVAALAGTTMGTGWSVRLVPPEGCDLPAVKRAITARLDGLVAEMSHWEPSSVLARFNRAPAGTWAALPRDFATVMQTAFAIAERSGGAFDPAIGRLVDIWGFGPKPCDTRTSADIAAARSASGWRRLSFEGARLRQPGGVALDLSGIAKGYAVDAIADLLGGMGIRHCLVEIGGELVGRGLRPDGDPWWVDLEAPPGTDVAPLRVALHQLAVATSGDHVRGLHTIDPRSGHPACEVRSVSVLHDRAMPADAWATALLVLGPDDAAELAAREGLACRLIHREGDAMREHVSPALAVLIDGCGSS